MATKQAAGKNAAYYVATHCPNQWDWATFHNEGTNISFSAAGGKIFYLRDGDPQINYFNPCCLGSIPHTGNDHFARITNSFHGEAQKRFCYFNPVRRRAVFAFGEEEPRGLFLFFLWHSKFNQEIKRLPEFLNLFLTLEKHEHTRDPLDFENFLKIREAIGENEDDSRNKLNAVAMQLIAEYESLAKNMLRQVEFIYSPNTGRPAVVRQVFASENMYAHLPLVSGAATISDAIMAILELKDNINHTIATASEIK